MYATNAKIEKILRSDEFQELLQQAENLNDVITLFNKVVVDEASRRIKEFEQQEIE